VALAVLAVPLVASAADGPTIAAPGPPKRPVPEIVWPDRRPAVRAPIADLASLRRVAKAFDFEDAERFPTELPRGWFRVLTAASGRPGYPDFGSIRLIDGPSHGGRWSLEFDCAGGSMAAQLPPGVVRVFPGSRYRISVWIRSEGLARSGLRITARGFGRDGALTGDEWSSTPIRSEGRWTQVQVDVEDLPERVADLGLELELVQSSALGNEPRVPISDDVQGKAWFDDLEVWQLPSIRFGSDRPANVFLAGEPKRLTVLLRDVVSEHLQAELSVVDIDGREAFATTLPIGGTGGSVPIQLPISQPGSYLASLSVTAEGVTIARRQLQVTILDPRDGRAAGGSTPRFGLILPAVADGKLTLLRTLCELLLPDFAVVPTWDAGFDPKATETRIVAVRTLVDTLLDRQMEPMLSIGSIPTAIAAQRHLDPWQVLAFFGSGDSEVRTMIEPWLFAFGQHVERWQLASDGDSAARDDFDPRRVATFADLIDDSVAGPVVLIPAMADGDPVPPPPGVARNVRIGWSARPGTVAEQLQPWLGPETVVTIEPAPRDELPPRARVEDLALRTLDAWRAGAGTLAIPLPWTDVHDAEDGSPNLLPEAVAWRELGAALGGRSFSGQIELGPGTRCWIADGRRGCALIAWRDQADEGAAIDLPLADGAVTVTSLEGARQQVQPTGGTHRIPLGTTPIVIEGVDGRFAALLASLRLDPLTIESRRRGQESEIVFRNPFTTALSGSMTIVDHPDWEIAPRRQPFSVPPGGEARLPIRLTLPRATIAGEATLLAEFEFVGGESRTARALVAANVDWPAVRVERSWQFARSVESGRIDVVVAVTATNLGTAPVDLDAFAVAKEYTQIRKPILKLPPGESATRIFVFSDGARRLSGAPVLCGVSDVEGDRRLAVTVTIPAFLPAR
jgi:hypothetical protein